jgi:hypothetical protein
VYATYFGCALAVLMSCTCATQAGEEEAVLALKKLGAGGQPRPATGSQAGH